MVGAEWKEAAKLQRGWRGKNQFSEDSVVKVDVIWGLKAPGCAWKYECFPFDQKFSLAIFSGISGNEDNFVRFSQILKSFWSGISIPCDLPPGISESFGWKKKLILDCPETF